MNKSIFTVVAALALAGMAYAEGIKGEYLEARNADVWTGPCFANAEIGIVGNKAIMAYKVTEGTFNNVRLDGLTVVAVVVGDQTLGIRASVKSKAALLVDSKADPKQQTALVALAKTLGKETIQEVVSVRSVAIKMETNLCEKLGCAKLEAGEAQIKTRCMCQRDSICGHEKLFYPALSAVQDPYAAYSLTNEYKGDAFGETFADHNARSAMIARFAL